LKVMSAIESCRTAALGGHVARCQDCAYTTIAYNSCRNSIAGHPPMAGGDRTAWLAFLNTVRTQRFDEVLALRPLLPAMVKAA
jgi:Transposase zinc-binding domain